MELFLECGGRGRPAYYQAYRRRRFGTSRSEPFSRRETNASAHTKAASPVGLAIRRPPSAAALQKSAVFLLALLLCLSSPLGAQQRPSRDDAVSIAIAGEYQRAYDIFRNLLHDAPDDPLLNYYTGAACVRMNKQAEGIDYLEKAVRHEAPFPQAYQELAEAYLKKKLNSQARDVVDKGLGRYPKNQGLQKLRAKIQRLKSEG